MGLLSWKWCLPAFLAYRVQAMKHNFRVSQGKPLIGPIGVPFGFNARGDFELTVHDFELAVKNDDQRSLVDAVEAGFYLQKFVSQAAFNEHYNLLRTNTTLCAFQHFLASNDQEGPQADDGGTSFDDVAPLTNDDDYISGGEILSAAPGIFLSMKSKPKTWKPESPTIEYRFKAGEGGLYFLIYQVCPFHEEILSTFELDFHFENTDSYGNEFYLSAGETSLPLLFLYFAVSYLLCFFIWYTNIRSIQLGKSGHFAPDEERPVLYHIHQLMTLLLLLKFLSVFFESVRYYFIKVTGHAEVWSFIYYAVSFVNGAFLFTVILLIGTGWSFVKPFLNEREKKVILAVLVLQVINNIAIAVLSQETEGESSFATWAGLLHIVDILCCCAVLVPVVWQINALEKSLGLDGADGADVSERECVLESGENLQILSRVRLFQNFYLVVMAYIYSTRILDYLFASMLNYRTLWVRYFFNEIVTLTFYVSVGMMFRPVSGAVAYQTVQGDDAATSGVELRTSRSDTKKH